MRENSCGIHSDNFAWNLESGEGFDTPEVMMTYSAQGVGTLSRNLHRTIRKNVCRGEWKGVLDKIWRTKVNIWSFR